MSSASGLNARFVRFIDEHWRGLDWDELERHEQACLSCGAQLYKTEGEEYHTRCKHCGAKGYGGTVR